MEVRDFSPEALGRVATPQKLVRFMVGLVQPPLGARVLEVGCADGPFLRAFHEFHGSQYHFSGIEIDPKALGLPPWSKGIVGDFLLHTFSHPFEVVIGNPPYGIVGDSKKYPLHALKDWKSLYQKALVTWKGKYNLYGAFIEKGVRILSPGGVLVMVVPGTWLFLSEFTALRTFLARQGRVEVYLLPKVFPGKNVSPVVLRFEKGKRGLALHFVEESPTGLISHPYREWREWDGTPIRFLSPEWEAWEARGIPLGELFTIRFAPRSPQFRSHPQVAREPLSGYLPLLSGRNLMRGKVDYTANHTGLWVSPEARELFPFGGRPHLVVGHTKGVRVVAAWEGMGYPWREEFHLMPRGELLIEELLEYLHGAEVQKYLDEAYRSLSPHLTLEMLVRIPVPREFLSRTLLTGLLF